MKGLSVLLIEDDVISARVLSYQLQQAGYKCHIEANVETVISLIDNVSTPDLFIIDIELGQNISGLALCSIIKKKTNKPILIISGTDTEETIVNCLDAGANQYITKPYRREELLARIRCAVRQHGCPLDKQRGNLSVDPRIRVLTYADRTVGITEKEAKLLQVMLLHEGKELSRDFLYTKIYAELKFPLSRCLDALVGRVRRKIQMVEAPYLINHLRSVGYVIHRTHTGQPDTNDALRITTSPDPDADHQASQSW
jgi:DNA-binding response OmpR family regulator